MTCDEFYHRIAARLGPQAHQHLGIDAPARRDTAIAGGSYRAPGTLVDGFRAGDADVPLTGVVVTPQATRSIARLPAEPLRPIAKRPRSVATIPIAPARPRVKSSSRATGRPSSPIAWTAR